MGVIDGETETTNVTAPGDYLVENATCFRERYFLPREKFEANYELDNRGSPPMGFEAFRSKRVVHALVATQRVVNELGGRFDAPWGSEMVVEPGDLLVTDPSGSEVYRIERRCFEQTPHGPDAQAVQA